MNDMKAPYLTKNYNEHLQQFKNRSNFLPQIHNNNSHNIKLSTLEQDMSYNMPKGLLNNSYQPNQNKLKKLKQLDNLPKLQKLASNEIPKIEPSKCSNKKHGIIQSYAANTHQGMIRNYNEDRVSIILNIMQPENKKYLDHWPNCCIFAIYDGHGGSKCADFLRENLHQFIIKDDYFPENPRKALIRSIYKVEKTILELSVHAKNANHDKSGQLILFRSCVILMLQVDRKCYVANVGDSRCILSSNRGRTITNLSIDHKPNLHVESKRIKEHGGNIYQQAIIKSYIKSASPGNSQVNLIYGPFRVFPGKLSVSRTIGDADAKLTKYGGNPNCVVCKPDIKEIEIKDNDDFIILGCIFISLGDGVFDKLDNKSLVRSVWNSEEYSKDFNKFTANALDNLMKEVFMSRSTDNISAIIVTFDGFLKFYNEGLTQRGKQRSHFNSTQEVNEIEYSQDKDDGLSDHLDNEIIHLNKNKLQKIKDKGGDPNKNSYSQINDNILNKINKK